MTDIQPPESVKMWKLGLDTDNIRSWNNYRNEEGYCLFCQKNRKFLTGVKVPIGINLDYVDKRSNKIHFSLPDGSERDILSGEQLALGVGLEPAFLKYQSRDLGINLTWSEQPVFEWRIFGSTGALGTPIPQNTPVAILNMSVKPDPDFFIYFNRPPGMGSDIGWTSSPGFWDQVGSFAEKAAVEAIKKAAIAAVA